MSEISNNIFNAVDILVDKKLSNYKADLTASYVICDNSRAAEGIYTVSNNKDKGTVSFIVYKQTTDNYTYKIGDSVYILIPGGDYKEKKFIMGLENEIKDRIVPEQKEAAAHFIALGDSYSPETKDLPATLILNSDIKSCQISQKELSEPRVLVNYKKIRISATLNVNLDTKTTVDLSSSSYAVKFVAHDGSNNRDFIYTLSSNDILANLYYFGDEYYTFTKDIDIDTENFSISNYTMFLEQTGTLTDLEGKTDNINGKIILRNVVVSFGCLSSEYQDEIYAYTENNVKTFIDNINLPIGVKINKDEKEVNTLEDFFKQGANGLVYWEQLINGVWYFYASNEENKFTTSINITNDVTNLTLRSYIGNKTDDKIEVWDKKNSNSLSLDNSLKTQYNYNIRIFSKHGNLLRKTDKTELTVKLYQNNREIELGDNNYQFTTSENVIKELKYSWFKDNEPIEDEKGNLKNDFSLSIEGADISAENGTNYSCKLQIGQTNSSTREFQSQDEAYDSLMLRVYEEPEETALYEIVPAYEEVGVTYWSEDNDKGIQYFPSDGIPFTLYEMIGQSRNQRTKLNEGEELFCETQKIDETGSWQTIGEAEVLISTDTTISINNLKLTDETQYKDYKDYTRRIVVEWRSESGKILAEKNIYLVLAKGNILASFETTAFGFNDLTEDGTRGIKFEAAGGMNFYAGDAKGQDSERNIITIWSGNAEGADHGEKVFYVTSEGNVELNNANIRGNVLSKEKAIVNESYIPANEDVNSIWTFGWSTDYREYDGHKYYKQTLTSSKNLKSSILNENFRLNLKFSQYTSISLKTNSFYLLRGRDKLYSELTETPTDWDNTYFNYFIQDETIYPYPLNYMKLVSKQETVPTFKTNKYYKKNNVAEEQSQLKMRIKFFKNNDYLGQIIIPNIKQDSSLIDNFNLYNNFELNENIIGKTKEEIFGLINSYEIIFETDYIFTLPSDQYLNVKYEKDEATGKLQISADRTEKGKKADKLVIQAIIKEFSFQEPTYSLTNNLSFINELYTNNLQVNQEINSDKINTTHFILSYDGVEETGGLNIVTSKLSNNDMLLYLITLGNPLKPIVKGKEIYEIDIGRTDQIQLPIKNPEVENETKLSPLLSPFYRYWDKDKESLGGYTNNLYQDINNFYFTCNDWDKYITENTQASYGTLHVPKIDFGTEASATGNISISGDKIQIIRGQIGSNGNISTSAYIGNQYRDGFAKAPIQIKSYGTGVDDTYIPTLSFQDVNDTSVNDSGEGVQTFWTIGYREKPYYHFVMGGVNIIGGNTEQNSGGIFITKTMIENNNWLNMEDVYNMVNQAQNGFMFIGPYDYESEKVGTILAFANQIQMYQGKTADNGSTFSASNYTRATWENAFDKSAIQLTFFQEDEGRAFFPALGIKQSKYLTSEIEDYSWSIGLLESEEWLVMGGVRVGKNDGGKVTIGGIYVPWEMIRDNELLNMHDFIYLKRKLCSGSITLQPNGGQQFNSNPASLADTRLGLTAICIGAEPYGDARIITHPNGWISNPANVSITIQGVYYYFLYVPSWLYNLES